MTFNLEDNVVDHNLKVEPIKVETKKLEYQDLRNQPNVSNPRLDRVIDGSFQPTVTGVTPYALSQPGFRGGPQPPCKGPNQIIPQ